MNANRLKLLMMGLMVLDHISYFVPPEWALIFHVITRCVGVFFGYMAVEGLTIHGMFIVTMVVCIFGQQSCLLEIRF